MSLNKEERKLFQDSLSNTKNKLISFLNENGLRINFQINGKYYSDNRIGGYSKESFIDDNIALIYINKKIFEIMENYSVDFDKLNEIVEDTVFHEIGHVLYEIIEQEEMSENLSIIKENFYVMPQMEDEDLEVFLEEQYEEIEYDIEENFAESFAESFAMYCKGKDFPKFDLDFDYKSFFNKTLEDIKNVLTIERENDFTHSLEY